MTGPAERDETRLKAQIAEGFHRLRFEPRLELAYQQYYHDLLRDRVPWVALSAIVFFMIYAVMDWAALPGEISRYTIPIRLLIVCPAVVLTLYAYSRNWAREHFMALYASTYLIGGLSVVAILWIAHAHAFAMPYEGLFIVVMFGFFLMGLSFRLGTLLSMIIVSAYLAVELGLGRSPEKLAAEGFFLLTGLGVGSVGAWLQEYAQRKAFLHESLLECARIRTERDSQAKSRFIAAAGHDLRQPLHSLALLTSALKGCDTEEAREALAERMDASVQHLNRLISNLLDVSRLSLGVSQPDWTEADAVPLIRRVLNELKPLALVRGVTLEDRLPEQLNVRMDALWVERIVMNLVVNAISHAHCTVVRVSALARGPRWRIEVLDNGRGIPTAVQGQIFREFYRGERQEGELAGMGLGLAIVRRMLTAMNAPMGVVSEEGKGSCFWFELDQVSARSPVINEAKSASTV
ncbi:HAMP domain-containing sensor histidine kinase [Hahella sp. SMD15-11]|uniref:histidine kinase n=1 Tax=Thermohahella caldifontis TaxID=3142973 RepID=A0AB39UWZ4_9GAMM